jgi:hypothetical protein
LSHMMDHRHSPYDVRNGDIRTAREWERYNLGRWHYIHARQVNDYMFQDPIEQEYYEQGWRDENVDHLEAIK